MTTAMATEKANKSQISLDFYSVFWADHFKGANNLWNLYINLRNWQEEIEKWQQCMCKMAIRISQGTEENLIRLKSVKTQIRIIDDG